MTRVLLGPALSLVTLAAVAFFGGLYNTAEATGRVVDDWSNAPLSAEVRVGTRAVKTGEDGRFDAGSVPRGTRLTARAISYGTVEFEPGATEIRLVPATLNLRVEDTVGNPIAFPEARKDDRVIGRGTETGNMVVAPHPGRDLSFVICATGWQPIQFATHDVSNLVRLGEKGAGCPLLPGQTPSPSPAPSLSP